MLGEILENDVKLLFTHEKIIKFREEIGIDREVDNIVRNIERYYLGPIKND